MDGSKLKLYTDHSALKWIWDIKSTVNSRLFKWSLILNPLRDKVSIIHRPGRMHNNVDPLSRYPASYSVNLLHVQDDWQDRLWNGYLKDATFRKILSRLMKKLKPDDTEIAKIVGSRDASTQTDDIPVEGVTGAERDQEVDRVAGRHERRSGDKDAVGEGARKVDRGTSEDEQRSGDKDAVEKNDMEKGDRKVDGINANEKQWSGDKDAAESEELKIDRSETRLEWRSGDKDAVEMGKGSNDGLMESYATDVGRGPGKEIVDRAKGMVDRESLGEGVKDGEDPLDGSLDEFYEKTRDRDALVSEGAFSLMDKCLFFSEAQSNNIRLCIPNSMVPEVLRLCHNSCGHPGIRQTYSSVSLRFYFRKMSRRIK